MNLKGIGINTRNWVDSAQDRDYLKALVNAALNLRVPQAMALVNSHPNILFGILFSNNVSLCSSFTIGFLTFNF